MPPAAANMMLTPASFYSDAMGTPASAATEPTFNPAAFAAPASGQVDLLALFAQSYGLVPAQPPSSSGLPPAGPGSAQRSAAAGRNGGSGDPFSRRPPSSARGGGRRSSEGLRPPTPRVPSDLNNLEEWQRTIEAAEAQHGQLHPAVGRAWMELARALQAKDHGSDAAKHATKKAWDICMHLLEQAPVVRWRRGGGIGLQ